MNYAERCNMKPRICCTASANRPGIDALLDDRDERPGVKFKDADLIGIPVSHHAWQEVSARHG